MAGTGILDSILVYNFIKRLVSDFKDWDAFKTGVIDEEGNVLISSKERTSEQRKSFKTYDVMIRNMKLLLAKIPGGRSKLATFAAALFLIKESEKFHNENMNFLKESCDLLDYINNFEIMNEDAPANNVGSGNIAMPKTFAGAAVFDVDIDKILRSRFGKPKNKHYKSYVGEDEVGQMIREYCLKNKDKNIILRNQKSGEMIYLRKID